MKLERKVEDSDVELERTGEDSDVELERTGEDSDVELERTGEDSDVELERKGMALNRMILQVGIFQRFNPRCYCDSFQQLTKTFLY